MIKIICVKSIESKYITKGREYWTDLDKNQELLIQRHNLSGHYITIYYNEKSGYLGYYNSDIFMTLAEFKAKIREERINKILND